MKTAYIVVIQSEKLDCKHMHTQLDVGRGKPVCHNEFGDENITALGCSKAAMRDGPFLLFLCGLLACRAGIVKLELTSFI